MNQVLSVLLMIGGIALVVTFPTGCSHSEKKKEAAVDSKEAEPRLTRAEVQKVWVPDRISGDEYEAGHWKYVIQRNSSWAKEE